MENDLKIDYVYLDSLFEDRKNAINFIKQNWDRIKNSKESEIKYTSKSDAYLGNETPSVFLKDYKKELKKRPDNKAYISYKYSDEGELISIAHYDVLNNKSVKCDCTYYFFDCEGYKYAVPFLGESNSLYPSYTFKYKYIDENINYVAYINSSSLWLELYDWESKQCKVFYYVPGLVECDKNVPVGSAKSPALISVKSLDFIIDSFSDKIFREWFLSNISKTDIEEDVYIVISEKFSSQYAVFVCSEDNSILSDKLEFIFRNDPKNLLEKIVSISKSIITSKKINTHIWVGFSDGEFVDLCNT